MFAVRRALEPPLLPCLQIILPHQPRRSSSANGKAIVLQLKAHRLRLERIRKLSLFRHRGHLSWEGNSPLYQGKSTLVRNKPVR
jgi:hypothetical protein